MFVISMFNVLMIVVLVSVSFFISDMFTSMYIFTVLKGLGNTQISLQFKNTENKFTKYLTMKG